MEAETKRPRGRPKQSQTEHTRVDVRVPPDVRRAARIAAAEDDMGMGAWVAKLIVAELERRRNGAG